MARGPCGAAAAEPSLAKRKKGLWPLDCRTLGERERGKKSERERERGRGGDRALPLLADD